MAKYKVFVGGTFDRLHYGHVLYLNTVRHIAEEMIKDRDEYDGVELIVFVSSDSYTQKHKQKPLEEKIEEQDIRVKNLESHKLLKDTIDDVVRLQGDDAQDHKLRQEYHPQDEEFVYFFGDDQYDTDWAIELRSWLKQEYDKVKFHWVDKSYGTRLLSSSKLRRRDKKIISVPVFEEYNLKIMTESEYRTRAQQIILQTPHEERQN